MPSLKELRFWKKSRPDQASSNQNQGPSQSFPSSFSSSSYSSAITGTSGPISYVPFVQVAGHSAGSSSTPPAIPSHLGGQSADQSNPHSATSFTARGSNRGITVLHVPDNRSNAVQPGSEIDIVFIHGLTGNSYNTWIHRESGLHWPRDLVKHDIPNARVLSWGYDADVASFWGHASSNQLGEHARNLLGDLARLRVETASEQRPIIFVVHSLGGLVIQKALTISRARAEPHLNSLEYSTRGIAFMGTPHNGSDLASWAVLGASLLSNFKDANVTILKTLERDSEILRDTQDAFGQLLRTREGQGRPIGVTCFFEEHALTGVGMVVPRSSACLFGYDYYGIPNNHKDMPKFAGSSDVGYRRVIGELKRWAREFPTLGMPKAAVMEASDVPSDFAEIMSIIAVRGNATSHQTLDDVLSDSFLWLWGNTSAFSSWLRSTERLFWVAGKPGSGKTTVMRHVAAHPSRIMSGVGTGTDVIIASHFFNSQAGKLERSIEGLLRSLVHQVLTQCPGLFVKIYPSVSNTSLFRSVILPWTNGQLENSIRAAANGLPNTRFFFLMDGLDEFDGDDTTVARFVRLFSSRLPQNAKVCVSSRPYTDFQFGLNSVPSLLMESHNSNDIGSYIASRLTEVRPIIGKNSGVILAQMIADKADGMFLWVRLAIDSLQRGWRRYEDMDALLERLREMPRDLVDFYQRILDEMDTEDKAEAIRLLVLFSASTDELSPLGFFHAWSSTANECMFSGGITCFQANTSISPTTIHPTTQEGQLQALKRFEGRVYALTRSLIQVSRPSKSEPARFFLLHETVQTFIRQRLLGASQLSLLGRPISGNGLLLHACVHYLDHLFNRTPTWLWTLEPKKVKAWSEAETDYFDLGSVYLNYKDYVDRCQEYRWTATSLYPFEFGLFHYAIQNVMDHAQLTESESDYSERTTSPIMAQFSIAVFDIWRRLYQIHEAKLARTLPVTLLGLAISQGLNKYAKQQIVALPPHPVQRHESGYDHSRDPDYLLFEAARVGNVHLADLLISRGARTKLTSDELRTKTPDGGISQGIPYPLGTLRHWGESALARAVIHDQGEMVIFLLKHGASVAQELSSGFQIGWAGPGGIKRCRILSLDAISLSLKRSRVSIKNSGLSVRYGSISRSGPSSFSSQGPWNTGIPPDGSPGPPASSTDPPASGLPGFGAIEPYSFRSIHYNALSHAIAFRSFSAFTAMLPFTHPRNLHNALIRAAGGGDEMHPYVMELLHHGADATWSGPEASCTQEPGQGRTYCCALVAATANRNSTAIIMALLQAGADPNFKKPCYRVVVKVNKKERITMTSDVPHEVPIDLLIRELTLVAHQGSEDTLVNSARLMLRYGGRIDYNIWDGYVTPERKGHLMAKLFPEETLVQQ
ncbi:hypothetical protein V8F06_011597 [Rhypophila decipiens]